jgi:hypothetical protein
VKRREFITLLGGAAWPVVALGLDLSPMLIARADEVIE